MIDHFEARRLADKYFAENGFGESSNVYWDSEGEGIWIFFPKHPEGQIRYGVDEGVAVAKDTGEIESFKLPSRKNFKILRNAKKIAIIGGET